MTQKEINVKKYSFYKYSSKYPTLYRNEYYKIRKIIPFAKIEHVGSSAVKNLGGKNIIDILICVNKGLENKTKIKLEKIGYKYIYHANDKHRMFFYKIIKYGKKERRVHVHLTQNNSYSYKSMIAVRNLLIGDKNICKKYENIKKLVVRRAKGDGEKYRKYKDSFLKKLERQAIRKYFKEQTR